MPSRFWRDAASLILISSNPKAVLPGFNYEVLTGIRSAKSSFMPKALVYPGGTISTGSDLDPRWMKTLSPFSKEDPSSVILDPSTTSRPFLISRVESPSPLPRDIAFRLTALRETFEETGILLSKSLHSSTQPTRELEAWRSKVREDPGLFMKMCHELELAPDIWALHEWSSWLTPLGLKSKGSRRFDTLFYMAFTDKEDHPDGTSDESEIFKVRWMCPKEIIMSRQEEDYYLGPPQVWETARLLNFLELESLRDFCVKRSRKGCVSLFPVMARLPQNQGFMSFLPGDDYYPNEVNPEQPEEDFVLDHVDEDYRTIMKYTRNRNRIYISYDRKFTIPFSNVKDPHGQVSPHEFLNFMIE
eukprot:TRINITY_DN26254_c0_g1_i1.p1 TRINITY_DN26254_c0_g1~~TRINITY_DN26254_c0_g1_i1.p1  ORF type:complete len:359 (-),score=84.69 TRINITY_DN26254_c0_g1_i1:70-1146(-)